MHRLLAATETEAPDWLPSEKEIEGSGAFLMERIASELEMTGPFEACLILTSDEEIRNLNRSYRNIDKATDVLSFPQMELEGPGILLDEGGEGLHEFQTGSSGIVPLGDIMISLDTCTRQAAVIGHSPVDEFARLLVHGLLHIFGYDHERSQEEDYLMQQKEDELLSMLDEAGLLSEKFH